MNQRILSLSVVLFAAVSVVAQVRQQPPTPAQTIHGNFVSINRRVLEMARDFPEDKYNYRPNKDVRSFAEVIVHITSGNVYASKAGRGEQVAWDELDPKNYKTKAEIVAALQKSIEEATSVLNATQEERFTKTLAPWMDVIEHAAEHYGQLVVYYRANGLTPPASRPKDKSISSPASKSSIVFAQAPDSD
jgi:uncharacterized damage-inducible protein DinB